MGRSNALPLMLFDSHIRVESVYSTACVKYLLKYCHKGDDFAKARIQGVTSEIEHRKTRYIYICR